jgi:2-oxoglutarate ferredoxin oxidoreductase subunit alpha
MANAAKQVHDLDRVTIKFAGDSGDGMQLTGMLLSDESALFGNDLATFPDFPAEIRAPIGTVAGVSGFQVQIGSVEIHTPGDEADALVAMNPAAFKANIAHVRKGAIIVIDQDSWTEKDLEKAEYKGDPLEATIMEDYQIVKTAITTMTRESLAGFDMDMKLKDRCKNMFALGMMFWLYNRPIEKTERYLNEKFKSKPDIMKANITVLEAGYTHAQAIELFASNYKIAPAQVKPGVYRQISGNKATALGFIAASVQSGRDLFLGSYPITPASDILHELSKYKEFSVKTVQAEDEIAAICMAIGASYAGDLGLTTTSGPGLALKGEALGLAISTELPLVVVDVQRGGPSTGLPTKTEQSDLMQALYGRHGESPCPVIAASTPGNCFNFAFEAARLAVEFMTPVVYLTDGYLANGSEPWIVPSAKNMPLIKARVPGKTDVPFLPFERDENTLARQWAVPGMAGFEHRIGGLEKQDKTGNVSYDPENHELMCKVRAEKVARIADYIPQQTIIGKDKSDLLAVGWGGTYGALLTAVTELQQAGYNISLAHFNYMNPLPKNTGDVLHSGKKVVVCELNLGQFHRHLQANFPDVKLLKFNKIQGMPFMIGELKWHFESLMGK